MACTLAESPRDPFHRKLRQLRCLCRRLDCYRVERTSSRAGVAPAEVQHLSTAHCFANYSSCPLPPRCDINQTPCPEIRQDKEGLSQQSSPRRPLHPEMNLPIIRHLGRRSALMLRRKRTSRIPRRKAKKFCWILR